MCTGIFLRKRKLLSQGSLTTSSSFQLKFATAASGSTLAFFFGGIFTLSTLSLVTIPSRMFPELSLCVNGQEPECLFSVNACESEYSKIDESGNIYEWGKISSSVSLVYNFFSCSSHSYPGDFGSKEDSESDFVNDDMIVLLYQTFSYGRHIHGQLPSFRI